MVSTRSATNVVANGGDYDLEISPAYLPFYTQISGTSMATPFVAGAVALLLDADPTLNPDEVKQILQETATQMPGYDEFQVGAGYINAYAAVDKVFNRSKELRQLQRRDGYSLIHRAVHHDQRTRPAVYDQLHPQTPGPQASNTNTYRFDVSEGFGVLDVAIVFGWRTITMTIRPPTRLAILWVWLFIRRDVCRSLQIPGRAALRI